MTPLTRQQISILATYMPEGVTDEDVELLVRKIEEIYFFNAPRTDSFGGADGCREDSV